MRPELTEAAQALVDKAHLRPGVTGRDVVLPLRDTEPEPWRRYLGFLFDGLLSQH